MGELQVLSFRYETGNLADIWKLNRERKQDRESPDE